LIFIENKGCPVILQFDETSILKRDSGLFYQLVHKVIHRFCGKDYS